MIYSPLNDYIIVKKQAAANTTASGIIIQSTSGSDTAKVIAMSADIPATSELKLNDICMIRWSNALKIDGDIYAVSIKEVVTRLL